MSESKSPRLSVIVAVTAVSGIIVTLLAQSIIGNAPDNPQISETTQTESQRIEALEAQVKALQGTIAKVRKTDPPKSASINAPEESKEKLKLANTEEEGPKTEEKEEDKNSFLEAIMALGAQESKNKVAGEVARLAERLGLNESQQEQLSEILTAKNKEQEEAGMRILTGKASLADLLASDEDNFSDVDAAMADLLSPEQLEDYNAYADDREAKRIEKKSNEDIEGLRGIPNLTAEQKDAAYDVFIELNAAEKPGSLPEGTTEEEFNGFVDQAIDNRIERLQPIFSETQLDSYRERVNGFRAMIKGLVSGGINE